MTHTSGETCAHRRDEGPRYKNSYLYIIRAQCLPSLDDYTNVPSTIIWVWAMAAIAPGKQDFDVDPTRFESTGNHLLRPLPLGSTYR